MKYLKLYEDFVSGSENSFDIKEIMKHYLACAVWTEEEQIAQSEEEDITDKYGDSEEINDMIPRDEISVENFSDDSKIKAYMDIKKFLSMDGVQDIFAQNDIDASDIGNDLWLTRNGHGTGFWDRDYDEEDVEVLTKACREMGGSDVYLGDDGKLHLS